MADVKMDFSFGDASPDHCFQVVENLLPALGYTIWKTRPIGWLILAKRSSPSGDIQLTFAARPATETRVSISLSCEGMEEEELRQHVEPLSKAVTEALG